MASEGTKGLAAFRELLAESSSVEGRGEGGRVADTVDVAFDTPGLGKQILDYVAAQAELVGGVGGRVVGGREGWALHQTQQGIALQGVRTSSCEFK